MPPIASFSRLIMGTLNKDKAAAWLMSHAGTASRHECAKYVREALEAGGLNTIGRPTQAKDYGPFCKLLVLRR